MTVDEEKKLDEKKLEEVSGGINYEGHELVLFVASNCMFCRHRTSNDCPYGDSAKGFQYSVHDNCPKIDREKMV